MRWLATVMVLVASTSLAAPPTTARVQQAAKSRQLATLAGEVEPRLRELVAQTGRGNLEELIRLATVREFGRYFARVETLTDGHVDTMAWLAAQPRLLETLMLHTSRADPPDRVLEVLRSLREDHRKKVEEFCELAAAMCLVWDAPERFGPEEDVKIRSDEICRVMGYFIDPSSQPQFDVRKTPVELLAYVVDLDLTDEEVKWAAARYGQGSNIAGVMGTIAYHENVGYDRSRVVLDQNAYVLPNILRRGGTCEDAARYAAQIGKLSGVPTSVVRGVGVTDPPAAAWVAMMQSGPRPAWDFMSARYLDHVGLAGEVVDPQTFTAVSDAEIAVAAGLFATPPRDRLAAMALCKSADLAGAEKEAAPFERALELSPFNRTAWLSLAEMASSRKLSDEQLKGINAAVRRYLQKSYPAYAVQISLRMLQDRGLIEFETGVKLLRNEYGDRPELMVALADKQRDVGRQSAAVATLIELLCAQGRSPAVALAVMPRLEQILRKSDELPRLAEIYREEFAALARPAPSRWGRTTAFYRIGEKYAALLDELKSDQAGAVRTRIGNIVISE